MVRLENVSKSYNGRRVLRDLSLEAAPGTLTLVAGPNGAGKTTLVNLLMRFYEVDAGAIYLDGTDIRDIPRAELRRRIGMLATGTATKSAPPSRIGAPGSGAQAIALRISQLAGRPSASRCAS